MKNNLGVYKKINYDVQRYYKKIINDSVIFNLEDDEKCRTLFLKLKSDISPPTDMQLMFFLIGCKHLLMFDEKLVIDCMLDVIKNYSSHSKFFHFVFSQFLKNDSIKKEIKNIIQSNFNFETVDDLVDFWLMHQVIKDQSVLNHDQNDNVMLTIAGMIKVKTIFENSDNTTNMMSMSNQLCIRLNDCEEVGDSTHLTSFDMLGFFSINNKDRIFYTRFIFNLLTRFKTVIEHININLFPLLTIPKVGLEKENLHITVYPYEDEEERNTIFQQLLTLVDGDSQRITYNQDNIWQADEFGTMGTCIEIFYKKGNEMVEVANVVSLDYTIENNKNTGEKVTIKNQLNKIDIGIGIERVLTILCSVDSPYEISDYYTTKKYNYSIPWNENTLVRKQQLTFNSHFSFSYLLGIYKVLDEVLCLKIRRKIADHLRTSLRLYEAGVIPGNKHVNYLNRKIVRTILFEIILNELDEQLFFNILEEYTKDDSRNFIVSSYIENCLKTELKLIDQLEKKSLKLLDKKNSIDKKFQNDLTTTHGINLFFLKYIIKKHNLNIKLE